MLQKYYTLKGQVCVVHPVTNFIMAFDEHLGKAYWQVFRYIKYYEPVDFQDPLASGDQPMHLGTATFDMDVYHSNVSETRAEALESAEIDDEWLFHYGHFCTAGKDEKTFRRVTGLEPNEPLRNAAIYSCNSYSLTPYESIYLKGFPKGQKYPQDSK